MNVYCSQDYNDTGVAFDTTRKAAAVAADLRAHPVDGVTLVEPAPATAAQLERAHDLDYLDALRSGSPSSLADSNGIGWDPHLLRAVASSTGGVIAAARDAVEHGRHAGSLSSGLHHARRGEGLGYCTVNGLAVAALDLRAAGVGRVLILDLDAHCGGGTADIVDGEAGIEQVDVSVIPFDRYDGVRNATLHIAGARDYLSTIESALGAIPQPSTIDIVLYNAGMDPHEHAGGIAGITTSVLRTREQLVFDWAARIGAPVAWVLAGGYCGPEFEMDDVVALHRLTVEAAA